MHESTVKWLSRVEAVCTFLFVCFVLTFVGVIAGVVFSPLLKTIAESF
jgi:hypothetical protein